ncbi:import receptor subunit tom40 [Ceratobasidium sp. AG-Ba]|nr:import receptor subunit tom40 [Ceratobasidium sp. AG-Ba]QRW14330.1 import receptor subunit tom40 [Ceratobasidium sp. AG-Ba]
MASTSYSEKALPSNLAPTPPETIITSSPLAAFASATSPFVSSYGRFASWRAGLGLSNPGTTENMQKEVKMTHATNHLFDGARADLSKALSFNPAFQVTHSFNLASYTNPATYNFGAVFANGDFFMQGGTDHEGNVTGRINRGWTPNNVTKAQMQIANSPNAQSMLQLEQDYQGSDYSLNFKAINPSPIDGTGIYVGSWLQSVTPRLALGFETVHQRLGPGMAESMTSYLLRWTSAPSPTPVAPSGVPNPGAVEPNKWIATAHLQAPGILQATYWQRLSEKVDVGADLQMIIAPGRRDAIATVGAKWDLRMSTMRAQVDSTGKVAALLEQRFAPTFAFLVGGEIDHVKNQSKVGVGIMLESSAIPEEAMMAQQQPPSIPL